jgi:flagellar hook-associated protein 3 FlgL
MRVSTHYQFLAHTQNLSSALDRMFEASNIVATGIRLQNPSDDPCGAALVLAYNTALANTEKYLRNAELASNRLSASEDAIGELTDIIGEVKTLTLSGANGTTEQTARDAMVSQINQIQERLIGIGNRQLTAGQYLFSGQAVNTKPFTRNGDGLVYNGDYNTLDVEIQQGEVVKGSVVGDPLFTDIYSALETIKADLSSGNVQKLGTEDIELLDSLADGVLQQRAELGALLQRIEATSTQLERQGDNLKELISDRRDADMAEAIAEYQAAQTAYQAALVVTAASMNLSLVDFISGG